jgi:hypothetical protein
LEWKLCWIVFQPYYKNGTDDGLSGSHHRKDECQDKRQPNGNESRLGKPERRNEAGRELLKDEMQGATI